MTVRAAGILIVDKDGKALFLKRGPGGDMPGLWAFPGGRLEDGETPIEAAIRETKEEAGYDADPEKLVLWTRQISPRETTGAAPTPVKPGEQVEPPAVADAVDFTTFLCRTGEGSFLPMLGPAGNPEHVGFAWAPLDQPPEPLHPGCRVALRKFRMNELDIAEAIATGELTSPQKYMNVLLIDIRITGSKASYRPSLKEYVWRDPKFYLNDRFLKRCNGLQVIVEHPPGATLTSDEFNDRTIGSIFYPHIKGDEVWGIAKIYDAAAVELMLSEQLSTSPGVVFTAQSGNQELKLEDGSALLIEGDPALLDHIAVLDGLGVWDKGGPMMGVDSTTTRTDATESPGPEKALASALSKRLDAALDLIGQITA